MAELENETGHTPDTNAAAVPLKGHDLLSLLSIFMKSMKSTTPKETRELSSTLLGVVIDDDNVDVETRERQGGFFKVSLALFRPLLSGVRLQFGGPDTWPCLDDQTRWPSFIALKTPLLDQDSGSERNRKLWSSMATEVQILRNDFISRQPNIVRLFGISWRSAKNGTLVPSFVMEAAKCDLEMFLANKRSLDYSKLLGISAGKSFSCSRARPKT